MKDTVKGACYVGDADRHMVCDDDTSCALRFEGYLQSSLMGMLNWGTAYNGGSIICGCLDGQH